jgi:hypothetical protein|tara:strand:- start:818 stop:973 length:156 start_codon:yes stop_codon:yes gene_type:complete
MVESIIHFFKHFTGLCGEAHPSILVSGFGLFTIIAIYISDVLHYIKDKMNV